MFKQFFSDHKDAVLYSKVCVTLLRDFDVDIKSFEKIVGQNLIAVFNEFRQSELNAESIAVIIISRFLGYMKTYPSLRIHIPINEPSWIDRAMKFGQSGLVLSSDLRDFCFNLADVTTLESGSAARKAVKWFEQAAFQGNASAQACLGLCYEFGQGVDSNLTEAVKLYQKAAEQGDVTAQSRLGSCFASGSGVAKDFDEAVRWLRKAAQAGCAHAQKCLAWCYAEGRGVPKDAFESFKWYKKAARQMDPSAETSLGLCYEFGKGVAKDLTEAARLYRLAAEKGNATAQYNLADCYLAGNGVPKDRAEALKWYQMAADQGVAEAVKKLLMLR